MLAESARPRRPGVPGSPVPAGALRAAGLPLSPRALQTEPWGCCQPRRTQTTGEPNPPQHPCVSVLGDQAELRQKFQSQCPGSLPGLQGSPVCVQCIVWVLVSMASVEFSGGPVTIEPLGSTQLDRLCVAPVMDLQGLPWGDLWLLVG